MGTAEEGWGTAEEGWGTAEEGWGTAEEGWGTAEERAEVRDLFWGASFHHVSPLQFVVVGGSWNRMGGFAEFIAQEIGHPSVKREELSISKPGSDRFAFYKIGPVLSISVSWIVCLFCRGVDAMIVNIVQ